MRHLPLLMLLATPALAQEVDPDTGRRIEVAPVTEIDIETPLGVNGQLVGPEMVWSAEAPLRVHPPMLRLRSGFSVELQKSIDEVR